MVGIGLTKFIDFKNIELKPGDEPPKIPGIYNEIEGNLGKAFCFANIKYDGIERGAAFTSVRTITIQNVTIFEAIVNGFRIQIDDEDSIYITKFAEIPIFETLPEEAGDYTLKVTVEEIGNVVYSFVPVENEEVTEV